MKYNLIKPQKKKQNFIKRMRKANVFQPVLLKESLSCLLSPLPLQRARTQGSEKALGFSCYHTVHEQQN